MIAATTLTLAYSGLALIALSMDRHARQAASPARPGFRRGGFGLLALSLAAVPAAANGRFALIEWIGLVGVGGALVVLTLYLRPRTLPPLAAIGGLAGLAVLTHRTCRFFIATALH